MTNETTAQKSAQKIEGMPVSACMFPASVAASERIESVRRSRRLKREFRTHCTARKLTRKLRTRGPAYFAAASRPRVMTAPETTVNGLNERFVSGTRKPKTAVSAATMKAEPTSTAVAFTHLRTSQSISAPKAVAVRYPALEMSICEKKLPCGVSVSVRPLVSSATLKERTEFPVSTAASAWPPSFMNVTKSWNGYETTQA